jgi:hypothetical protein
MFLPSDGRMVCEELSTKDVEGNDCGPISDTTRHLPGQPDEVQV